MKFKEEIMDINALKYKIQENDLEFNLFFQKIKKSYPESNCEHMLVAESTVKYVVKK